MVKYLRTPIYDLLELGAGDHIRIRRRPVWHHMLVVKVIDSQSVQVIHYTGSVESSYTPAEAFGAISSAASCRTFGLAEIIEGRIQIDFSKETLELLQYPDGIAMYKGQQAIQRVREKLGEKEYCLRTNNCEHLINWAITGKKESVQIENIKTGITLGTVIAGIAILALAIGAILIYNTFNDDEMSIDES